MTAPQLWTLASALLVGMIASPCCMGCGNQAPSDPTFPREQEPPMDIRLTTAVNDLGLRLLQDLSKHDPHANVFVSPASVELALAMTYNGAVGKTKAAMARTLGLETMSLDEVNRANAALLALLKDSDPKVQIDIANSLWGRQGVEFDAAFIQRNIAAYGAEVRPVDFAQETSADEINAWVSDRTHGKIPRLVDYAAVKDALLVLVNALYFKGAWSLPFDKALTKDGPFTLDGGKRIILPMMRTSRRFRYLETERFQVISLPYGAGRLAAIVILPRAGVPIGDLVASLDAAAFDRLRGGMSAKQGTIVLPRFKSDYSASLKRTLSALGMSIAFSPSADFSGMVKPASLAALGGTPLLTDVLHKTSLEVNEEGAEAAAATGVVVGVTAAPIDRPFVMTVDHPFLLLLQDTKTGTLLFAGAIVHPK